MNEASILQQYPNRVGEILTAARAAREARKPESIEDRLQRLYNNDKISFEGDPKTGTCYFIVSHEHGDPQALDELIPLLTAQHTGKFGIERSDRNTFEIRADQGMLERLGQEHEARVLKADHRLLANYSEVAKKLKVDDPAQPVASFIETRLADESITKKLVSFAQKYRRKLTIWDDIKKAGQMCFAVKDEGDVLRVDVSVDGAVRSPDARSMFDVAEKVYPMLFGDQIKNIKTDTQSAPRTMSFECTGELRGLFEGWKENKVEAGVKR